jgi:hypothetical protein
MKVEILKACEIHGGKEFKKGDKADIQDAVAKTWIAKGYAKDATPKKG